MVADSRSKCDARRDAEKSAMDAESEMHTYTKADLMKRVSPFPVFLQPRESALATRHTEERVSAACTMPVGLKARIRLAECDSSRGLMIVLQAQLVLSGIEARVVFRDTPDRATAGGEQVMHRVALVPAGEWLPRQSHSTRGTPGRSRVSMTLVDGGARPLAPVQDIGACVEGITNFNLPFDMDVSAVAWLGAREWSEQRGPVINLSAEVISTRGVTVRLGFRSSEQKSGGTGESVTDFPLIRPGMTFYNREKTLEGGLTGSPWISVLFMGEGGRPIGEEQLVGRCVRG